MQKSLPIDYYSYYLQKPFTFKKKKEKITSITEGYTILKTLKTAICASDLHYYLGLKSAEKLKQRLPLILLHEGVCLDVIRGTRVVPIAYDLNSIDSDYVGRENIYPQAKYMGATAHGMAREYFLYPENLLIPISPLIEDNVATLVEPLSVVLKAIKDIGLRYTHKVIIIGDGGLAYLLILMIHYYSNIPKERLCTYGVHEQKLEKFAQFGSTINIRNRQSSYSSADIVFEVVGGKNIQKTMNLAMNVAHPGSMIGIFGISDEWPNINVNKIVNQGIIIKGLTRSTYNEYEFIADFLKIPQIHYALKKNIYPEIFTVKEVNDLYNAFDRAKNLPSHGRVIIDWGS